MEQETTATPAVNKETGPEANPFANLSLNELFRVSDELDEKVIKLEERVAKARGLETPETPVSDSPVQAQETSEPRNVESAQSRRRSTEVKRARRGLIGAAAAGVLAVAGLFGGAIGGNRNLNEQEAAMEEIGYLPEDGNISESYDDPRTESVETVQDRAIVYFAEQATGHRFGPEGEKSSHDAAFDNMFVRMQADPALLTANSEYAGVTEKMTPEQREARTLEYAGDREAYDAAYDELLNHLRQEGSRISLSSFSGDYHTMYMVPRGDGQPPMIYQSVESMEGQMVLRVDLPEGSNGGGTLYFKIDCGYQPVSPIEFEGVPTREEVPEATTTTVLQTTTTVRETTTTVPETTTTVPETTTTVPETTTTVPETTTTVPETTTTTVPETTTTTVPETTTTTVPETTTTTVPETTTTTVPETTTTTVPETTTTTVPETTTTTVSETTTTVPPKHDDEHVPGPHDEEGEPDVPGEGPAEQEPDPDGYLPGETPVTTPEAPPTTVTPTTQPPTTQAPATTAPQPTSTLPPQTATTSVATTVPQTGPLPEQP